jgi:hypothetical protein
LNKNANGIRKRYRLGFCPFWEFLFHLFAFFDFLLRDGLIHNFLANEMANFRTFLSSFLNNVPDGFNVNFFKVVFAWFLFRTFLFEFRVKLYIVFDSLSSVDSFTFGLLDVKKMRVLDQSLHVRFVLGNGFDLELEFVLDFFFL